MALPDPEVFEECGGCRNPCLVPRCMTHVDNRVKRVQPVVVSLVYDLLIPEFLCGHIPANKVEKVADRLIDIARPQLRPAEDDLDTDYRIEPVVLALTCPAEGRFRSLRYASCYLQRFGSRDGLDIDLIVPQVKLQHAVCCR